jgi:hypothetical protein
MNRESNIEFDRNYCIHYAPKPGLKAGDYCAIGCDALKRMNNARQSGEPNMTPCIGGHKTPNVMSLCPSWVRRSLEQAEKLADDFERAMERMEVSWPVIIAWRNKPPIGKTEIIECPCCKGKLHLSQSAYNGHVCAQCETDDCLNWMQ